MAVVTQRGQFLFVIAPILVMMIEKPRYAQRLECAGFVLIDADRVHSQDLVGVVEAEKNRCLYLAFSKL